MTTDATPNVLDLNKVIDRVTGAMDAIKETAEAAGVDLSDDMPHLERELDRFFATRDEERDKASAVLKGGA